MDLQVDATVTAMLFESATAGVALVDRELRYVRVNAALAAMNGLAADAHLGRRIRDVLPAEAAGALEVLLGRVIESGEAVTDIAFAVQLWGVTRNFLASYWPVRDSTGATGGVIGVVAERTPAEAALRDAEGLARQLFVLSPLPTWVFDRETLAFLEVNEAALHHYGYTREEFFAMTIRDIRPPEDLPRLFASMETLESARGSRGLFRHRKKSGEIIDVEVFSQAVERAGRPAGIVVVQDVTERHRGEVALHEATRAAEAARAAAERDRDRTARLQALTAALAGARTVEAVADVVVAEAVAATGAASGILVVRATGRPEELVIVRHAGLPAEVLADFRRFPPGTRSPVSRCIQTGEATFMETEAELLADFPELRDTWSRLGTRALATVPLSIGGETVGAMSFTFAVTRPLPTEDRAFFLALGRQAAQAIERARLFESERRARQVAEAAERRVAFLADASARLAGSLDVEATLRTVAEVAVPSHADWCLVHVVEEGAVRPAAVAHRDPSMARLVREIMERHPPDLGAPAGSGKVLRTGESELYPEITDEALRLVVHDEEDRAILQRVGFRSALIVPLFDARGGVVAALTLVSAESWRRYGAADLAMLEEVARRASAALESARLYSTGQAALRRTLALQRVSSALAAALTAKEVAEEVVRQGRAAVGAVAGSVAVVTDAGRTLQMLASEGYDERTTRAYERFPLTRGRPLSDAVLDVRPTYLASYEEARLRYPFIAFALQGTGLEAYVALPVMAGGRPVAGLSFSFADRRTFDAEERAFLETLASQAGQALERAQLVDAERAARAEAEGASRAKSQFLATMSHELRTPLNAIGGHVQLVEMELHGPLTPAQREALTRVQRAQRHLLGLINDVLNFARLESGRVEYDLQPIAVRDVVGDVLPLIEPQIAARQLTLEVRLPDAEGERPFRVLADREKLGQVLLNLLSNAVKFTEPGGRILVEVAERDDGSGPASHAHLRVSDTGVGIPADKLESIFEPFVQVGRSYTQDSGGTGLGLAISRDLVRGMGGDLRARSGPGEGSSFTVTLRRVVHPDGEADR